MSLKDLKTLFHPLNMLLKQNASRAGLPSIINNLRKAHLLRPVLVDQSIYTGYGENIMKKGLILNLTVIALSGVFCINAHAITITYDLNLKSTLYGSDITDIFIFETDGNQVSVDYTFTVASQGPSTISHEVSFDPTLSLVLGLDLAPIDSGLKDHLVVFMNYDFAADALTKAKFSEVFPGVEGRDRVKHSTLVNTIKDFQPGDSAGLLLLTDFFTKDGGMSAAFDPNNSFRVVEFSPPKPIDVIPEPASMILFGSGLLGMLGYRRKR